VANAVIIRCTVKLNSGSTSTEVAQDRTLTLLSAFGHHRRFDVAEDKPRDEFGLGGSVLNILADRLTIPAKIEHDIFLDLDALARRLRPKLDIEAVGRSVVTGLHGAKALGLVVGHGACSIAGTA
jgi:hypothetical protein